MICDLWGFTCESSGESVCENNVWITSMWNSRCFAIQWELNTCESPCEVYENMCEFKWGFTCESLCETPCEKYVKICVKGLTSLHTLFTNISLCKISHACEICVWNACEKCVKNVWKESEKGVKIGEFSHVFHLMFHIHTPSSETWSWKMNLLNIILSTSPDYFCRKWIGVTKLMRIQI